MFRDDGTIPNNPHLPFLVYRGAINLEGQAEPRARHRERVWRKRLGRHVAQRHFSRIVHYHSMIHEALGIARDARRCASAARWARCWTLGRRRRGAAGRHRPPVPVGDARTVVIGAYPKRGSYDLCRGSKAEHAKALKTIPEVPLPDSDPVHGKAGPLTTLWQAAPVAL